MRRTALSFSARYRSCERIRPGQEKMMRMHNGTRTKRVECVDVNDKLTIDLNT